MRLLPAGSGALLAELPDLEAVLALVAALKEVPHLTGVTAAARTVLIRFDPVLSDAASVAALLHGLVVIPGARPDGKLVELPVCYDGEDLAEVAALLGLSAEALVARHAAADWRVGFTGFAPGFAYLGTQDPIFDLPRRAVPRQRIPAGSVALAGRFSGVYPAASPGGWQLIGRTDQAMWDITRDPPARLAPGDRVRFVPVPALPEPPPEPLPCANPATADSHQPAPVLRITSLARPVLWQDPGRPGLEGQGVGTGGAMDRAALALANRLLGNPEGLPVLEMLAGGLELAALAPVTLALTGALGLITLVTAQGQELPRAAGAPLALDAGEWLRIGAPARGVYGYLALRGGFAVGKVLGSAARDTLAALGPEPLAAGDLLRPAGAVAGAVAAPATAPVLPAPGELVWLDILAGPRDDWFDAAALALLTGQEWRASPALDRVGIRLEGALPLGRAKTGELISEPAVRGALQVPHSGQPVLFGADHPLTGGYPVIACIADHHLDIAAQIPPGTRIRFTLLPAPPGLSEA